MSHKYPINNTPQFDPIYENTLPDVYSWTLFINTLETPSYNIIHSFIIHKTSQILLQALKSVHLIFAIFHFN